MDKREEYMRECTRWLSEHRPSDLKKLVNTIQGTQIDISQMSLDQVVTLISNVPTSESKGMSWKETPVECDKCKQSVVYMEKQTRGADEGTTVYYRCTNCPNSWVGR